MRTGILLLVAVIIVFAGVALADQETLDPTQDVGIFELFPNDNFAASKYVWVGYDDNFKDPGFAHTLIQFDLSPYMGAAINDANLRVFFYGGWGGMAPGDVS